MGLFDRFRSGRRKKEQSDEKSIKQSGEMTIEELRRIEDEKNKKRLEESRKLEEITKQANSELSDIMNGEAARRLASRGASFLNEVLESKQDPVDKELSAIVSKEKSPEETEAIEKWQKKLAEEAEAEERKKRVMAEVDKELSEIFAKEKSPEKTEEIEKPVSESSKKEKPIEKKIPEVKKQEERSVKAEEIKKVVPEPPKKEEKIVKEEKIEKKIPEIKKQDVAKNTKDEEIKRKISEAQKQHYNELNATMNANSSKKSPKPTTVSMASLDDFFGAEKLSQELANKDSNYAYVTYLKPVSSTEMNHKGELVQFNRPSYEGEVDLISATELERLNQDFPDNIKGKVIKYGDLENVLSYVFDGLKKDYSKLDVNDDRCKDKMQYLDSFAIDGKLTADHQDESSLSDLANKVFNFQESVRDLQYNKNIGTIKK